MVTNVCNTNTPWFPCYDNIPCIPKLSPGDSEIEEKLLRKKICLDIYLDYKDLVHLAIMYLTFSKWCICSKKQGIRSKSLLVASLSKSIFLTPGSSFPKGISIWRIMSASHQSCPFLFPVILMHLQKGQYLSKNIGLNKCESRIYS